MRDMYQLLDMWGAWAAAENSGVDWSPIAAGFKGLIPHSKQSRTQCSDDEGLLIDRCVSKLKQYKKNEYELLIAHFILGISLRTIAKIQKCSDGKVRKNMKLAIGFIEGLFCVYIEQSYRAGQICD